MDGTVKVHRKHRQRRHHSINSNSNGNSNAASHSNSNETDTNISNASTNNENDNIPTTSKIAIQQQKQQKQQKQQQEKQQSTRNLDLEISSKSVKQLNQSQTVLLVNGETPNEANNISTTNSTQEQTTIVIEPAENRLDLTESNTAESAETIESQNGVVSGGGEGGSSRNSSGDAMSLRETLKQLPTPAVTSHHHHRSRHSRNHSVSPHSPQSPMRYRTGETVPGDGSVSGSSGSIQHHQRTAGNAGIHGFMERELKQGSPTSSALSVTGRKLQTLSDPTGSPAPRSLRSRSSLERSPRRKRSKSESRRRRERKLIAAGEMEVRQANETLMRYLKQCSEMNDASLSGELEIDQNYDERRVQRKTKSQRDKRGHIMSKY